MNFKLTPSETTIKKVEELLDSNRYSVLKTMFPDILAEIKTNLRWGLFFNRNKFTASDFLPEYVGNAERFHVLDPSLIEEAEAYIKLEQRNSVPFLSDNVKAAFSSPIAIYVDYDETDITITKTSSSMIKSIESDAILETSLPPSDLLFSSLTKSDANDQPWVWEFMDLYEEMEANVMNNASRLLWQIGGYGNYRQGRYDGQYLGQINIGIGDNGAIYLLEVNNEIAGHIDMS